MRDINNRIAEILSSGEGLKNFYRFAAQNPHISLHDACQIIIKRPNASVCFSFEEWNALDRRINKGSKGIPYIDSDGQRRFTFDANDTHGDGRYRRLIYPMKRLLKGLDVLNGTSLSEDFRGDYRKIKVGVATFLNENDYFTDDEERNSLLSDGVAYYIYCKTGFPKSNGIRLDGLPYDLQENATFFMNVKEVAEHLQQEVEQAYQEDLNKVEVIDDTEEETVSDEPVLPPRTEKVKEEPKPVEPVKPQETNPLKPLYQKYIEIENQYPKAVVLYRLGDFYEVFGENAITIAEELELMLTGRDFGLESRVPMVGFPFHTLDKYAEKILEKHSIVIYEQDEEPKYILSDEELFGKKEDKRPELIPVSDEDMPFDFEEDEEKIEEDVDYSFGEEIIGGQEKETQIQSQGKKSVKDRKKKEKPQISMFDELYSGENGGENPREKLIKRVLCKGSGFEQGKFHIMERYESDPSVKEFAVFLKDEYGTGGSYVDNLNVEHDSKGICAKYADIERPENNTDFLLNWNEVANKISDYIDNGEYLTPEQSEEYKQYLAERTGEPSERNKAIVDHIIRDIRHRDARGYYRFFGSSLYADYQYINEHASEINEELMKFEGVSDAYSRGDNFYVYGRALDEKTGNFDSASDILERKQELLENAKHGFIDSRIKAYADYLFLEGTTSTNSGNWVFYFDEFGEEEQFVRENAAKIGEELCLSKGVESLSIDDDCIDVNFYTDFCPQVSDESDETIAHKSREKSRFNRFKELTAEDRAFVENYSMRSGYAPTYSMWGEVQDSVAIANGIYSVSTASHGGFMVGAELAQHILSPEALKAGQFENGYYCYEEDCDKNITIRELYDKGILTQDNQYFTRSFVRPDGENGGYKPFTSLSDEEKEQFFKEWNKTVDESLAYWNKEYWQAHEGKLPIADKPSEKPEREEPQEAENTDLNEIGFDQSELGGAKARFQANLEAIRLLNQLYDEDRLPTKSERLVLAKYVGWGGLAKAFDEHDPNWRKEYEELKTALSFEDYDRAKASVLSAHYTSKEVIEGIYKALSEMGVKGNNRILEPAMGTGNFFGFMPKEIADGARLYGVELDSITGRIAQKLYPNANIQVKGFEQTSFSNNRFDIVVGNVPFGAYTVYDSEYAKHNFYIHDYFLAKSIDKLKPNGLMAVITSTGTMDKLNPSVRKYLAERAELLGAIRLPNTAFKQNAGTEVVADILFFRKREEKAYISADNTEWLATGKTEEGYEINNYFIKHPEMVLGTLTEEHGLYGALGVTVKPDGRTITEALNEAIGHLPKDIYLNPAHTEEIQDEISVDYNIKPLCYKAENGKLFMRVGDEMEEQEIPKSPKDAYERICEMINLRSELRYVLAIQTEGCSDEKLQSEQRILNANYDHFVKRYGYLNSQTNTRLFRDDADSALLFACEEVSEDRTKITKADIFSKRTIRPYVAVTSTDDCFEAFQISKNERGQVDISYIEELTGKDYDTVLKELDNAVFRIPAAYEAEDKYTGFVTAEEYLSGNVVKKLEKAKRYAEDQDKAFEKNVKALEAVQPTPIPASDIGVRIGASWIDTDYYKQFLYHLLELPTYYDDGIEIYFNQFDSSWRVDKKGYFRYWSQENANEVYGTSRANAYRLFEDCLNLRATTIYDTVENSDGSQRRVLNQAETIAAREKQNKIKEAFVDWIFDDPTRREELEKKYNSVFNQTRLPSYDGSYLRFPGMNPEIELKPHQKDAVHRIVSTGQNTLLHHVVGSGKTFTMFAAGMKLRQYGLAKKIMYAVPNHLVEQWAAEGRKLYPNAKILVATKDDLSKEKRQRFVSKVAMGDWDAIIIAQSSFAKIPISPERQIRKIQEEIRRIEETIEATWMDKGMPRGAVKNLEKIKKNREAQLKKLLDDDKKDNVLIFENLGVDYLFIDEAHYYKNKFLFTKMNNVAGISTTASQRASDLELKCEYINELHGDDKGVVFATGTPISNSMTEMYTMQSYLQREELQRIGITFFDQWAANFGETITSLEMAPSGQGYKARTRFSKFTNLPELLTMYRSFADVQTQDMVKLDVPDVDRKVINLKPSDTVLELADEIAKRAEIISKGGVPPEEDNMLKVTSDGKKLALDPRCFDRASTDEEGSKINECASRIFEIWEDTADVKGTQIVFCDLSTPKKAFDDYEYGKDFDVYNDLKYKLVQMGIPKEEIAYIHDANGDKAKQALFDKVNSGAVRVLIGSTEKCGAGTNVQERLIALHHLDTPYRPSDMQQREGRIIRQGNTNKEVQIYTYVTERTFDSYSYQILENKQKFISQIDRGDLTVREAEDIDERTLNYAEIKAITAANPKIKRKMEVDTEIARLRVLEGQYKKNLFSLQDKIRKVYPEDIKRQTLYLERLRSDIATIKEKYDPEAFSINVQGKTYTDKKEGGQALMDALFHNPTETVVAEYGGMKIALEPLVMIASERSVSLTGAGKYSMEIGQSASGLITRLDNFLEAFPEREARAESKLSQLQSDLKVAESQVGRPFEHKDTLAALVKEQAELNAELDLNKREEVVIDEEKDDTVVSVDSDEVAMGLPKKVITRKYRKKLRKPVSEMMTETYKRIKDEEPSAYVFLQNGTNYEIYGEQAKELAASNNLTTFTETVSGDEIEVLSVDFNVLDQMIRTVVGNGHKAKIIEEMIEKEETFIDNEDKIADMNKANLPKLPKHFEKLDYHEYSAEQDYGLSDKEGGEYDYLLDGVDFDDQESVKLYFGYVRDWFLLHKGETNQSPVSYEEFMTNEMQDEEMRPIYENFAQNETIDSYEKAKEYLSDPFKVPPIDYKEAVIERVEKEYDDFRDRLINEPSLNVFHRNYEIHVKTELMEVITDGDGYLDEDDYKALYREKDGLLQLMYDDFTHNEFASVNNFGDTAEFIKNYIDYYLKEKIVYYGKDTENTAYYRLLEGHLSRDSLSEITEKADNYVIVAQALAMSNEELEKHHIVFLKEDRDISVEGLNDSEKVISNMQLAVRNIQRQRAEEYRRNMRGNVDCKQAIEQAISENFDGMHLKDGFENALIERFGFDRVKYVLSNTVQIKADDGRFSATNKEWARETEIAELEAHRYQFIVESHPAVLDGFINRIRNHEKQKSESKSLDGEFLDKTKNGYAIVNIIKDDDERNIAIVYRQDKDDFIVAIRYDTQDGTWGQGLYVSTLEKAEKARREQYGEKPIIYENKEWKTKTMAEENKKKWITVLTAKDALIKKYDKSSLMRMPTTGEYAGYTYFLFNDRIKDAYQTTDIQSDSRELAYSLRLGEKETVLIKNMEEDKEVELSAEEFNNLVDGKTSQDYIRQHDGDKTKWTTVNVPSEAMLGNYENSSLFIMPNNSKVKGSFYVPNTFVSEDTESDDERFRISVPDDFTFTVKNRDKGESVKLSAYQLFRAMNDTQAADYERKPQERTKTPKSENTDGWKYVSVSNAAFITEYSERDMFRMPQGEYAGYCYYIPRGLLRYNEEKETVRISLPEGFVVSLFNKSAVKEEEKKIEMRADDFIAQVKGKTAEDYEQFQKPSESKKEAFAIMEKQLRENVPEEMLKKPNWVVVRTKENAENGRLEKYLIDVHTDKFAESDNPETWTTFEKAAEYAKEKGGVTLAYALDGKDGICCIDLDHCIDENGERSNVAKQVLDLSGDCYCEKSISGHGLHIFGKTEGLNLKAFSKDGTSEMYQKSHFIAMTGNVQKERRSLSSFDELPVRGYLLSHHDKRTSFSGVGKGVEGLSSMSDRDVIEKACNSKHGDVFKALYEGQDLQGNHSNSDMSLMNRLAYWCNGDKEQMLRIFATSGLYRDSKSPDYYEGTAIKAIRDTSSRFQPKAPTSAGNKPVGNGSDKGGK